MPPTLDKKPVGADGMVDVWDITTQKWKRVPQVDAREYVAVDSGSLVGPTVHMANEGGTRIVCCEVEVQSYESQGYKRVKAPKMVPEETITPEDSPPGPNTGVNFMKFKVDELRTFATKAELEGDIEDMTKTQLAEALDGAGFNPEG